ncbi:HTH_Tnp_Tc3_2 domain-containing protein [Trichonephila clavipes]|nr:HTH_Tnp_Tc3_2 domain-containing protein [Trichonephila clavipes]
MTTYSPALNPSVGSVLESKTCIKPRKTLDSLNQSLLRKWGTLKDTFQRPKKCLAAGFELITTNCQSMKEAGWANRRIVRHMDRRDATIRRCWQEWVYSGRFQRHNGRSRLRAPADRADRLIIRSAATAPDSSLSTMKCAICPPVSTMTTHKRLIE